MSKSYNLGKNGEAVACKYLSKEGYIILERNFRSKFGEIDIIALEDKKVVFIEVKTRRSLNYGRPSDSVNYKKKIKLKKTIEYYNCINSVKRLDERFDIIEILYKNSKYYINHIKACEL